MPAKKRGKVVIEIGFQCGGGSRPPSDEIDLLKRHLTTQTTDPPDRNEINSNIDYFFQELNKKYELSSFEIKYNFYHVLEDPDEY